jgi:hypothetical protein
MLGETLKAVSRQPSKKTRDPTSSGSWRSTGFPALVSNRLAAAARGFDTESELLSKGGLRVRKWWVYATQTLTFVVSAGE